MCTFDLPTAIVYNVTTGEQVEIDVEGSTTGWTRPASSCA